jgi:outer membrane murein-binding lipoprotein Lpp
MKKKIINGIMMVALVAATSTSFVSCKDTNEDVRVEMQGEYATLLGKLNALESKYGDLDGRVGKLETKVKNMAEDIATLQTEVDALETWLVEAFAKLVYGVEISGTYNNMLGSINIPGFEPKMLINNYGVAEVKGSFPKSAKTYEVTPIEWTANKELGSTEKNPGFAGYVYANVNRYLDSTPMLSKAQGGDIFEITIANTAGESVKGLVVKNTNAEGGATTDVLNWGWTRADNNIFKFKVEYQGEKAKDFEPAKIDLAKFKTDLKKVWADRNRATGTSKEALGHLVADLYYNLATKDFNMKKYGLKFAWKDATALTESTADYTTNKDSETGDVITYDASKEEKVGLDHIVTSEAELVFAAIKPLGFNGGGAFAEKVDNMVKDANTLIEKAEVIENKIFDKIKAQIPNFDASQIATIEAKASTDGTIVAGNLVTDGNNWWVAKAAGAQTYTGNEAQSMTDIIKPLNLSLQNVKDMFTQLNAVKEKLNAKTVTNWAEKFTNKFKTLFDNNASQMLQPVLLAIDKEGNVNRVSGTKASPLEVSGEVRLEPTTYTAELFAPAYLKFLGCKDIKADGFNTILTSNEKVIKFTPEAGKTYEIVYEAADYAGNIVDHTYYIKGKK